MSTAAQTREFLTERSSDGGVDLFRRSRMGFILVDTFDTDISARSYIATLRTPQTAPVAWRVPGQSAALCSGLLQALPCPDRAPGMTPRRTIMYTPAERDGHCPPRFPVSATERLTEAVMTCLSFRLMTRDDIDELKTWYGLDTPDAKALERFLEPPSPEWIAYVMGDEKAHAWAVLKDGDMVAYIQQDDSGPNDANIAIAVKPGHFGQGIATAALTRFVKDHLSNKDRIFAHIEADNPASLRAFLKAGFRQITPGPDEDGLIAFCYKIRQQSAS